MELNADFTRRVAVHAAQLPWVASPIAGIERRMLDRIGDEVARATSIVRYAPHSRFTAHTHGGGEEFLVLDGVFSDEHGDFPAGSYVRNPPSSRHTPGSEPGCTIFVKLWQFDQEDRAVVRIDTNAHTFSHALTRPGVEVMPLHSTEHETVCIERWACHQVVEWAPQGGAEFLVLDGDFEERSERFTAWSWLRLPAGAVFRATAGSRGARVWVKTGHLARPPHIALHGS
jgi:anti-sigma factor ChrR (cupin superfamily)